MEKGTKMAFDYDYSAYDSDGVVDQGTLASTYTNALSGYLQSAEGADIVAYLAYVANGGNVEAALALKAQVEAGNFKLADLFSAAQSKTGAVDPNTITDPDPKLTVSFEDGTSVTLSLSEMLTGADSETWTTLVKNATIYHTREFLSESAEPEGYSVDWAAVDVNEAPTATPLSWAVSEYDEHAAANSDPVSAQIDLLSTATDADGDVLSVVAGSVKIDNGDGTYDGLPDYLSVDASGNLVIDTNSAEFDALYLNGTLDLDIVYEITDGTNTISNSVDLTIAGTADQFSSSSDASASVSSGFDASTWDGSFIVVLSAPADAFDFSGIATVTVTGDIDNNAADNANDEIVTVTLEGGDSVTLGAWDTPPNQEGSVNYSTRSGEVGFSSSDASVSVAYDSNTAGGVNGVDGLSLVQVDVTASFDYWM